MKKSPINRADLLQLQLRQPDLLTLLGEQGERSRALKKMLAYHKIEQISDPAEKLKIPHQTANNTSEITSTNSATSQTLYFWYAAEYQPIASDEKAKQKIRQATVAPEAIKIATPPYPYLATWQQLEPRLHSALSQLSSGHQLDVPKIIDQLGRATLPACLPYQQQKNWGSRLQVIDDRSKHLAPYLPDHKWLQQQLQRLFPHRGLQTGLLDSSFKQPMLYDANNVPIDYLPPENGKLLILSDLGCLAKNADSLSQFWVDFAHRLRQAKCKAVVLLPCSPKLCSPQLQSLYHLICWEHPAPPVFTAEQNQQACENMLDLLAYTWRYSPGLLRSVRLALGQDSPPASIESLLWQHSATEDLNVTTSAIKAEELTLRQQHFRQLPSDMQQRISRIIRQWHYELPIEIWYSTLWNLPAISQQCFDSQERQSAASFLAHIANRSLSHSHQPLTENALLWVERNLKRLSDSARNNPQLTESIKALRLAVVTAENNGLPAIKQWALYHHGDKLRLTEASATASGSPLATLSPESLTLEIQTADYSSKAFWQNHQPPDWADNWGKDCYGLWCEFVYNKVRQRMRWIPPGSFLMGSPDDESGRFSDESPRHQVNIEQGYWMFDTPVTQALWQAVMGDNPSEYKSPDRPVEQVSWENCQDFIQTINQKMPGLALSLPSEACWEYACRAGSTTALYNGDIDILGENNAPALDGTAWYGGNSRVDFELDNGYDASDWKEKQYEFSKAGTHPVKQKAANDWGLFDYLGFRLVRVYVSQAQQQAQPAMGIAAAEAQPADQTPWRSGAQVSNLLSPQQNLDLAIPKAEQLRLRTDQESIILQQMAKPDWASGIGRDQYGLWVDISYQKVRQRLRWIAPGQFVMGSPDDEPGRYDRESPQHQVILKKGYWMFDTPVTQALWQVVMGENPSYFKSPDRPVENVSWDDCVVFIDKLNGKIPQLNLSLPSEAMWEYACRAGSQTDYYVALDEPSPDLGDIAWYSENSAEGFDLENHEQGTHIVKQKIPNVWGLYDMLGNVWEWTADTGHDDYAGAPLDGSVWEGEAGAERVFRGGCWYDVARFCRAAYRNWDRPDGRNVYLGFRLVRVHL